METKRKVVAIAGATGGIGEALVRGYARRGVHLLIAGRNEEVLRRLRVEANALGAYCESTAFDFRDHAAVESWCHKAAVKNAELLILCAGVSASVQVSSRKSNSVSWNGCDDVYLPEAQADLLRELEVNAVGNILAANAFARAKVELMQQEGKTAASRIVFISSLAALTGLAGSPGYSASKAALRTYGEALRRLLERRGIGVTVIFPGYVESNMSRRYLGAKPWLMSADKAAGKIMSAIDAGKAEYAFPWILAFGIRLLNLIPRRMQNLFLKEFFFTVEPDAESRSALEKNKSG